MYECHVLLDFQCNAGGYELKLYNDKTYMLNEYWHGSSRHYFGKYELKNSFLTLNDKRIMDKTEMQMTSIYKYNSPKKF